MKATATTIYPKKNFKSFSYNFWVFCRAIINLSLPNIPSNRQESSCDEVVSEITKTGGTAISVKADIASEADVNRVVEQTKKEFKRIDILVNNAAVNLPYRTVLEVTPEEWNWLIGANLTGTYLCCHAVLPQMIAQRYGKIINFSSIGGRSGAAGRAPYRAAKSAIINFTECLAAEVKEFDIDVNAICPGAVATDMLRGMNSSEQLSVAMPPEHIAAVALFLAYDDGRAITGTAIDVFGRSNPLFGVPHGFRPPE
ncbi:SDR family NAD(P)-dependent oxidoreductase [Chloroflexota bacterium]